MLYIPYEQTATSSACTGEMGSGKQAELAQLQDRLTGALVGLARATEGNSHMISAATAAITVEGLLATQADAHFDSNDMLALLDKVAAEKRKLVPACYECTASCGRNNDYNMQKLQLADEDTRALKLQLLSVIRNIAAHTHHAVIHSSRDDTIHNFLYKALYAIGMDDWGIKELMPILKEAEEVNLSCNKKPLSPQDVENQQITSYT